MNKALFKNMLIVFLLTIAVFCVFKYILALKEKETLSETLNQLKEQIVILEKEKQKPLEALEKEKELQQKLIQENIFLKENVKASRIRLLKLFRDVEDKQRLVEALNSQLSILKAENRALAEEENKLQAELTRVSQENENLKLGLSSTSTETNQKDQTEKIIEGNRGYFLKDGRITYPAKVRIEVSPALP